MVYTYFELLFLFFVYSMLGWIAETIVATVKGKSFLNRGFASGPFCFIYGFSAVVFAVTADEQLMSQPVFLFLGCAIIATLIEWNVAKLLERMHHQRWWNYSGKPLNIGGYICLQYTLLWGALGTVAVLFGNRLLVQLYGLMPPLIRHILIWCLIAIGCVDMLVSLLTLLHLEARAEMLFHWSRKMQALTLRLGGWLANHVEVRMTKAYPAAKAIHRDTAAAKDPSLTFAKLLWLFTVASFLGDITETLFCRVRAGVWMSRSSLVWGPFSIVWGGALVIATILLHREKDKSDAFLFALGTVAGGAYEYVCSAVSERVFGAVFWDYSKIPFNLSGRINLLYCFFWGIAAVLWIKVVYPWFSRMIDAFLKQVPGVVTWLLALFMVANVLVSAGALGRYTARSSGLAASSSVEEILDERFDDARMERIYPNIIVRT